MTTPPMPGDSISYGALREKETSILVNRISILLATLPLIYISINVFNLGWSRITPPIIMQPLFFLLPVAFNYLKAPNVARIALCWSMPFQAITFSLYNKSLGLDHETAHYTGILFSILASSVIPFLVFRSTESALITLALLPSVVALFGFDAIHNFFGVGYRQVGLSEIGYSLTPMRVFIAFILIGGSSLFLRKKIEKEEEGNQKLIRDLFEKNDEIQAQVEEITLQNEQISNQNTQLETHQATIENQNQSLAEAKEDLEQRVEEKVRYIIQANRDLEKQNEQLEQFAFMTAHHLRSPVARIMGLSELIRHYKDEDIPGLLQKMTESCVELDEVMHDLILVLQVRTDKELKKEKVKVFSTIEDALEKLKAKFKTNEIDISNLVDREAELIAEKDLVQSIFFNLLDNSIKFRKMHQPQITIRSSNNDQRSLDVEIVDNGIGFDAALYNGKLFKPFARLNTTHPGKGFGLYLVKIQVESIGGQVSLQSSPNSGTTVKVSLPGE
jgi:signal transduction histidine kinase